MEGLEKLRRKAKNAADLHAVVGIMKSISSSNIHHYEQAVQSLQEYSRTIEMGLQIMVMHRPVEPLAAREPERPRLGAVIFGSDQGLCGSFNDQIASFAMARLKEIDPEELAVLAVGGRVVSRLLEAGLAIESQFSFSGSHPGITRIMLEVLIGIEEWRAKRGFDRVLLFYNRPASGATFAPHMDQLFPLDVKWLEGLAGRKWPSRTLPTFSMDFDRLFAALVRNYLFFSLYRAFVDSLASESASRLSSMQAAERNIEDYQHRLNVQYHRQRQEAITSELLDVVTGYEALAKREEGRN